MKKKEEWMKKRKRQLKTKLGSEGKKSKVEKRIMLGKNIYQFRFRVISKRN